MRELVQKTLQDSKNLPKKNCEKSFRKNRSNFSKTDDLDVFDLLPPPTNGVSHLSTESV